MHEDGEATWRGACLFDEHDRLKAFAHAYSYYDITVYNNNMRAHGAQDLESTPS